MVAARHQDVRREETIMAYDAKHGTMVKLRSQIWFDNPDDHCRSGA